MDFEQYYQVMENGEKWLFLPDEFNDSLLNVTFHSDLKIISFGLIHNQIIDDIIFPEGLRAIYFSTYFNQSLDNVKFPDSVESLHFGFDFNQSLDNVKIMEKINTLHLGEMFNKSLSNIKFNNLKVICISNNYILDTLAFVPELKIIEFKIGFSIPFHEVVLPDTIQAIYFSKSSSINFNFDKIIFPKSLIKLVLPLEKVTIKNRNNVFNSGYFNYNNSIKFPEQLQELSIGYTSENITNLPISMKKIFTINEKNNLNNFQKLPFGCVLYDINTNKILNTKDTVDLEIIYNYTS
jgi:hypothetical protein